MNNEERALNVLERVRNPELSKPTVDDLLDLPKNLRTLRIVKVSDTILRKRGEYQCKAEKLFKAQKMYKWIKAKCRRDRIPFNLTVDYLIEIFPDECPVFKLPFYMDEHGYAALAPSVDKIEPELGYIEGNVQIISRKANMMKQDASLPELYIFAQWAENLYLDEKDK